MTEKSGKEKAANKRKSAAMAENLVDALASLGGIRRRAMFGGHGIFADDKMFALISSEGRPYLKVSDANLAMFEEAGAERFRGMPYYEIPVEVMEMESRLRKWANHSISVAKTAAKT